MAMVPSAHAHHTGESTRSVPCRHTTAARNSIWFFRKYRSRPRQILLTFYLFLLLFRVTTADALRRRRPRHAPSAARGIVDGWVLWPSGKDPLPGEPLRFRKAHSRIPWAVLAEGFGDPTGSAAAARPTYRLDPPCWAKPGPGPSTTGGFPPPPPLAVRTRSAREVG